MHDDLGRPAKGRRRVHDSTAAVPPFSAPRNRPGPQRNAPSRLRLRPAFRLTAAEATADRRAIDLGRSVLGASRTLGAPSGAVKAPNSQSCRNLRSFLFATASNCGSGTACSSLARDEKKAGHARPGRKNSPSRERFRPPSRRTFRFRVVLLGGLRPTGVPCSAQAESYVMGPGRSRGSGEEICRSLRPFGQPIQP